MRLIDADKLIYQSHAQHLLPYIDKKDIDNAPTVEVAKDCISREALLKNLEEPMNWTDSEAEIQEQRDYEGFIELVKSMPSVTPKYTDEEIQKMQELEQAQLEKAYELGKAEARTCEDCRNCKRWDECPCGKEGHTNGTSIGYSIGECKDYEPFITPSIEEWLSSFNTDSATECFTAVQHLKEKIEKEN